jgi:hypothetical protein
VKGIRVLGIFYLLLLMRSFEGYSSSWDFLIQNKGSLRLDSAIQEKRLM